jgi:hypothetical protein
VIEAVGAEAEVKADDNQSLDLMYPCVVIDRFRLRAAIDVAEKLSE